MRIQTSKRREKDPARVADYQRRYREKNPESFALGKVIEQKKEKFLNKKGMKNCP